MRTEKSLAPTPVAMDIYSTILTSIKKNDTTAQSVIGSIQSASRGAPADAASHVLSPPPSAERKRASTPTRGIVGITTIDSSALIPTTNVTTTTTTTTTTTAATTYVRQSPPRNLPKPTVEAVTSGSPLPKLARKRARTSSNSVPNSPPPAANISKPDTLAPASSSIFHGGFCGASQTFSAISKRCASIRLIAIDVKYSPFQAVDCETPSHHFAKDGIRCSNLRRICRSA